MNDFPVISCPLMKFGSALCNKEQLLGKELWVVFINFCDHSSVVFFFQSEPIRVVVTGAAGQIGYSLLYPIAKGDVFGAEQVSNPF